MNAYATIADYRTDTGDDKTADDRIQNTLDQQAAKLRLKAGITESTALNADQMTLARMLVIDAARKMLVSPMLDGIDDTAGLKDVSFSANGFQVSHSFANPSGSAYFDRDTFNAFKKSLKGSQRVGIMAPFYGA